MEKQKVLVIEDDETARNVLKRTIDKEGFSTLVASDGKEGMSIFKKELPEIVITDLKMPHIDGMEILHTVKRDFPDTEVILVTAYGDYDTAVLALREGAIDYLKKPIDLEQLVVSLGRCEERIVERKKLAIRPTVLVMEDDELTRDKLARVLAKEDWDILTAADGEEGMKLFNETKVDVMLVDIKMPKKDGLEVLHEIREKTKDCEVIVITGYGDETTAIQAMRDGAINYIRKPIDLDQMILAVQKALEKVNLNRSILYVIRELELANQVIARITQEREIVVDVGRRVSKPASEFAQKLIDTMPVGLLVVDKEMKVVYSNQPLCQALGYEPQVIDKRLCDRFSDIGIEDVDVERIKKDIQDLFETKGEVKTISLGKYAYITATRITIMGEQITPEAVIVILRGTRAKE